MAKYRKRPIVIEAIQYDGSASSLCEIRDEFGCSYKFIQENGSILIKTLEGEMWASRNDWIIKGVKGEFYPCKPDIFEITYEPVENE